MNGLALCSGAGGIDLGLRLALGKSYRTVCHVEREAYAAAILVARMEDAALDHAPVWDDLLTFDGRPWRGVVDLVTAGFPCQPWSVAGKRRGTDDDRWIWPDIVRIIGELRPALVFLENVPGLYRHGLRAVLSDLAALGFDAEWGCFSAAAVGAPHKRERVFILAHAGRFGFAGLQPDGQPRRGDSSSPGQPGEIMADAEDMRRQQEQWGAPDGVLPGDAFPPGPQEHEAWAGILETWPGLAPAVGDAHRDERRGRDAEPGRLASTAGQENGGDGSAPKPGFRGLADGMANRVDRLRSAGNGAVPVVVAAAFRTLAECAGVMTFSDTSLLPSAPEAGSNSIT